MIRALALLALVVVAPAPKKPTVKLSLRPTAGVTDTMRVEVRVGGLTYDA